ncbi:YnfU family zinc-binding protein [Pantoea sp.]|uniref:YnfU family zinc-binding protein n=1 Tax=Pantoea sp. TaxID=69393 RepID=UPI0031D36EBE
MWLNRLLENVGRSGVNAQCPVCKKFCTQSAQKKLRGQAMLCPHCKSLFIMNSEGN